MNKRLRIIHLEDLRSDADLVARELRKGNIDHELMWVTNKPDFEAALGSFQPDIVLSDHSLPTITSVDALKIVKALPDRIPFILITATVSEEFAVNMMKEGISDYILKDRLQRLPSAVLNAVEIATNEKAKERYFEELASERARFRSLIESARDAIVLSDRDFNVLYRSPSAEKITGYSDNERKVKNFLHYTHFEDKEIVQNAMKGIIERPGVPHNIVFRTLHKSGSYVWIDATFTNMLRNKSVGAIVTNFRDISEIKSAEIALRKTGQHFRALIENISDAIVLIDSHGRILYHSPSVERITGLTFHEAKGREIFDFFESSEKERARKFFESIISNPNIPIHNSFRLVHSRGHVIWVEGTITNLLGDESVNAFVINYREITERKEAEERIRKSEANLRTIFNNTDISYVLLDKNYRIVSFNEIAAARYLREINVRLEEGVTLVQLVTDEKNDNSIPLFQRVLSGEKINYETSFSDQEGFLTWYNVEMYPVYDEQQGVLGFIISSEDITARKAADMEKERMTTDLVHRNKDLEQFAYIISHNLRSPVANILGLSNLLDDVDSLAKDDLLKCLQGVKQSVKKIDEVIIDLNSILQSRRTINEPKEHVSLSALVNDIKTLLRDLIERENISLQTNFTVNRFYTVKSYLHSIFYNLILNSIKYRNSKIRTVIQIFSQKSGDKIILRFRDNGLGIDMTAYGNQLFGLYKKFHHHIDGKGMGLYMVKTQIEILGGSIRVNSEVNKGTEFIIEMPDL